jgi:hypothetical protein
MNDSLNLHSMNCESLSFTEMTEISGGGFWSFLASIGIAAFLIGLAVFTFGAAAGLAGLGFAIAAGGFGATVLAGGIGAHYDDFKPFGWDLNAVV